MTLEFKFTLNSSLGEYELEYMPVGWDGAQNTLKRNMRYEGVMNNYSLEQLEFTGGAYSYLKQLFTNEGVKLECEIRQYQFDYKALEYKLIYVGILNGRTYRELDKYGAAIAMKIGESSLTETILARVESMVLYGSDVSLNGNEITIPNPRYHGVYMTGMEILYFSEGSIINGIRQSGLDNDNLIEGITVESEDESLRSSESFANDNVFKVPPKGWFYETFNKRAKITVRITGNFKAVNYSEVFLNISKGTKKEVDENETDPSYFSNVVGVYNRAISNTFETIDTTQTFEIKENEALFLRYLADSTIGNVGIETEGVKITFDVAILPQPVTIQAIKAIDLFRYVIESITDQIGVFESPLLEEGGEFDKTFNFNGYMARGYSNEVSQYSTSLNDIFPSAKYMFNGGLAIYRDRVVFDKIDNFYLEEIAVTVEAVSKETWARELDETLFTSDVDTGYNRMVSEQKGALFEYNGKSSYTTPIDNVKGSKDTVLKVRGDGYGITFAIELATQINVSEDSRFDRDNFFIDTVYVNGRYQQRGREGFSIVNGIDRITTPINLDFAPARLLLRNSEMFTTGTGLYTEDKFVFGANDNKTFLETKKEDEQYIVKEGADIELYKLKNPRFSGFMLNFGYTFTSAFFAFIIENRYKRWKVKNPITGEYHFGWIYEVFHTIRTDEVNVKLIEQFNGEGEQADLVLVNEEGDFVVTEYLQKIKING